jgi:EmrB/QacA subfamily drug resistance transporter
MATAGVATEVIERDGHPRRWLILAAVSLGMFMTLLDVTIVNIAIPAIITDLDTTVANASWVVNAYSLALAVLFLSMGGLADRLGRKQVFLTGLTVFTVFSLLCGLAPSIGWLVAFRVGQGVGGAAMTPLSLALLFSVFPRRQTGMAFGIWGAISGIAAAVGPSLGGILIEYGSWHWVFFINVPVGMGALIFGWAVIPRMTEALHGTRIDYLGVAISAVGLFCLVLGLIKANDWGWTSGRILGLFAVAIVSYVLFVLWETRTKSPMFDFRLLRIRSFTAANTAMMFIGAAMGGAMFLLVIFLVSVLDYSELHAALAVTPMALTAFVLGPIVGRLVDRVGPRFLAAFGAFCFGTGMVLLAGLDAQSTALDATWRVMIIGVGMGFTFPTFSSAAMGSLPREVTGVGSGALNTLRQVGFSIGVAVLVAIFTAQMTTNIQNAATEAQSYVNTQTAIPAQARAEIDAQLQTVAEQAANGAVRPQEAQDLLGGPSAPAGSPQAQMQEKLQTTLSGIFKDNIAKSFSLAYYAAALMAYLAVIPALFTGRRVGEHEGHHERRRSERMGGVPQLAGEESAS